MTKNLETRTINVIRQLEEELVDQKDRYQKLLKDFNYNLNLLKDRDVELEQQDVKIMDMDSKLKRYVDYDRMRDEFISINQRYDYLSRDHQTLKNELSKTRQTITDIQIKLDQSSEKYQDCAIQMKQRELELQNIQSKYEQIRAQYQRESQQNDYNVQQYDNMKQQFQDKDRKIQQLQQQLDLYQLKLNNDQESKDYIAQLQKDNKVLAEKILDFQSCSQLLTQENEKLKGDATLLIGKYKTDVKELKKAVKDQSNELRQTAQKWHQDAVALQNENERLKNLTETYENQIKQVARDFDNKQLEVRQLQEQLAKIDRSYIEQLSSAKAGIGLQYQEISAQLKQVEFDKRELQTQLYEKQEVMKQLTNQYNQLQQQVHHLSNDQSAAKFKLTIQNMTKDYQQALQKIQLKEEEIRLLQQQISQYRQQITSLELNNKQLIPAQKFTDLVNANNELQLQNQNLGAEIKNLQMQLLVQRTDPQSVVVLPEQVEIINQLRDKLKAAGAALRDCLAENEQYHNELQELRLLNSKMSQESSLVLRKQFADLPAIPKMVMKSPQMRSAAQGLDPQNQSSLQNSLGRDNNIHSPDEFPSKLSIDESELHGEIDKILKRQGF